MDWLIGIICVVIFVRFWRIFLPLGVTAVLALVAFYIYDHHQSEKWQKAKAKEIQEIRTKVATAQQNATSEGKEWIVLGERDHASGETIARTAAIKSDDSLCVLTVQKQIDGSELTGLDCPGIEIPEYRRIFIRFDTSESTRKMKLEHDYDSDRVYISSDQYDESSGYMSYESFIDGLINANAVAIKIPSEYTFWVRFSLKGGAAAISKLGKEIKSSDEPIQPTPESGAAKGDARLH
jgi:hypothetical protein